MSDVLPLIDLDALDKAVARITTNGQQYDVLPIDGSSYDLVLAMRTREQKPSLNESLDISRKIVKQCVPTLPDDERLKLSVEKLTHIIAIATRQVEAVETFAKAAEGKDAGPL